MKDPEQEPVAWMWDVDNGGGYTTRDVGLYQTAIPFAKHTPLYAHPPQRTWVALTPEEVKEISLANRPYVVDMVVALEARLKQKNGYD
jgi:hypothetical protein